MDMEMPLSATKVFREELLRETILDYVINDGQNLSGQDIRSCRLVQKSWLYSVSRCLRKAKKSLFHINLTFEMSVNGGYHLYGLLLDTFVQAVTGETRIEEQVPPFRITATEQFFRAENFSSFKQCLVKCGTSLVELYITFPSDGGSMPFLFPPNISFPRLRKFTVRFSENYLNNTEITPTLGNSNGVIYLMHPILSASPNLQEYHLTSISNPDNNLIVTTYIPIGFEYLAFPSVISELKIDMEMQHKDLQVLANSTLPNLKRLSLLMPEMQEEEVPRDLMFQILENVRTTLNIFTVLPSKEGDIGLPVNLKFPLMEKLKEIRTSSLLLKLERDVSPLQLKLPLLERLVLKKQSESLFSRWVENSTYESVTDLTLVFADAYMTIGGPYAGINSNAEMMPGLQMAFPNLTYLDIFFCGMQEKAGVQFIFRNLRLLERLQIRLAKTTGITSSDYWDALLIGIPVEWVAALRKNPELWSSLKVKTNEEVPSVTNLTELKELKLIAPDLRTAVATNRAGVILPSPPNLELISDAAFHFAFLKMSKLKKIELGGRFFASPEMNAKWTEEGRLIHELGDIPLWSVLA